MAIVVNSSSAVFMGLGSLGDGLDSSCLRPCDQCDHLINCLELLKKNLFPCSWFNYLRLGVDKLYHQKINVVKTGKIIPASKST
jgi:hypothetical protein